MEKLMTRSLLVTMTQEEELVCWVCGRPWRSHTEQDADTCITYVETHMRTIK
jgi:hypothetical protein